MSAILEILLGWWWYAGDGRGKTAAGLERFVLPGLLLVAVGCFVALLTWTSR